MIGYCPLDEDPIERPQTVTRGGQSQPQAEKRKRFVTW